MYIRKKKLNLLQYFYVLGIIINISIIIHFFIKLFIQTCICCFYMLVSWFLIVHICVLEMMLCMSL